MSKIANKTINYSVYVREGAKPSKITDTTGVQLPSIEFLTDTIKGSGISGEIDLPSLGQVSSMELEISTRTSNEDMGALVDAKEIELRWVTDIFNSATGQTEVLAHKAFLTVRAKKIDEGKVEAGAAQEGSYAYEVLTYKRIINGKEVLYIDKLNCKFVVNGKNLLMDVESAL